MATELDNYLLAPESGLFETLVDLGQRVEVGEPVGRIHFLERPDREPEVILSKTAGIVCVVRAIATTEQGDNVVVDRARGGSLGARLTVKRFKVAATQVDVRHTDVEHNLEIHLQLIAEAAEAGCELDRLPGDIGHREQRQRRGDPVRRAARRPHLRDDPGSRRRRAGSSSRTASASASAARTTTRRRSSARTG